MKRRVVLILIIVMVFVGIAGVVWYLGRHGDERLLVRSELAIKAGKFDRAVDLAKTYTNQHEDESTSKENGE